MKQRDLITGLVAAFGLVVSIAAFASETETDLEETITYTQYECGLLVDRPDSGRDMQMTGVIRIEDGVENAFSYLTLEPNSSQDIPLTARILLTRFEGDDYFPMSLHPRGNTTYPVAHKVFTGKTLEKISYKDGDLSYYVYCRLL